MTSPIPPRAAVLAGVLLLVGVPVRGAVSAPAPPVRAYALQATLSPSSVVPAASAPGAAGTFAALVVRTAPRMSVPTAGSLPAGCELVPAQRRGARPARISCDLGRVVVPLTKTSRVRWVLAWRLTVTGLSGRAASARVHEGRRGENGPALHELCRPCGVRSSGRVVIAAKRAMAVIGGATYLTVGTAKRPRSELRGQIARTRLGVRARLSALTHTPKVDTRWPYAVRVTDLRGKAVRARVTVEIVDPFGGVHPVEFGGSDDTVADHRFTGTFRDYVIWPPESAIPGIELVFRPTVRTASGTVVLTYTVSPRRAEGRVAVARPPGERTGV